MEIAFIRPAEGPDGSPLLVRQPERAYAPLPAEGAHVGLSTYWLRRLRDGDVVRAEPPAELAPAPAPEADADPEFAKPARRPKS